MSKTPDEKFALAKSVILAASSLRLYSFMFFKLNVSLVNDSKLTAVAYAYKNKLNIAISRNFIKTLNSANELVYIIIHEITHILCNHLSRGLHHDQEIYNVAADHVINTNLDFDIQNQRLRGLASPSDRIIITSLVGQNLSTEEVYKYLMDHATITRESYEISLGEGDNQQDKNDNQQNGGNQQDENDQQNGDNQQDGNNKGQQKPSATITGTKVHVKMDDGQEFTFYKDFIANGKAVEDLEKSLQDDARRILNSPLFEAEKKKGNKSSNTLEMIQEAIKVNIPWDQLLEHVIKTNITEISENKTWKRVNKRMYPYNMIFPYNDLEETYDTLMVVVDTSGSISTYDLQKVVDIIKTAMYHFKKVIKVDHDVKAYIDDKKIYDNSTIDNFINDINVEFVGRGGTSHKFIYEYIEQIYNGDIDDTISPGLILFITDFYSDVEYVHKACEWPKEIPYKFIISGGMRNIPTDIDPSPIFIDE